MQKLQRNVYIDFLKGIAALGIISIHTAFWGGQSYTPEWFRNLTLMVDVPFFFFLSGYGASYHYCDIIRACKGLGKIWIKWIYFISALALVCLMTRYTPLVFEGVTDLRDLINNYMFHVSIPGFPVVGGSIWFMQYYFMVIFVNAIIMTIIEKSQQSRDLKKIYNILLGILFIWVSYDHYILGMDCSYFLFYSFFWMLGQNRKYIRINTVHNLIADIIIIGGGFAVSSYLLNIPIYGIQTAKFPPTLMYGFFSMFVIVLALYFESHIKKYNRLLVHIGQNAIFYYFGQGIGSSLNYYAVEKLLISNWFVKWCITYLLNVFITIMISELLSFSYKKAEKFILENLKLYKNK